MIGKHPAPVLEGTSGAPVELSVQAEAVTGTLSYQWRRNGVDIPGKNAARYEFILTDGAEGMYDVKVSADGASVTSLPSRVTMIKPVKINREVFARQARNIREGGELRLGVVTTEGTPPFTYRWQLNNVDLKNEQGSVSGADSPQLSVKAAPGLLAGNYKVIVSNAASPAAEASVLIGEILKPNGKNFLIEQTPATKDLVQGSTLNLSLKPAGSSGSLNGMTVFKPSCPP